MTTREEYQKQIEAQLAEWRAEIERLTAKTMQMEAEGRAAFDEEIEKLKSHRSEAEAKLEEMRTASEAAFDDMRHGFEVAWTEMAEAFKKATTRF